MGRLTDRQRRYAALVALGRTPLEAIAAAGYVPGQRARWLRRNRTDRRIAALVKRLRADLVAEGPGVTREGLVRMLAADRRLAYREGSPGAAVAASVAIGRISGWIGEGKPTRPLAELSDAELQQLLLEPAGPDGDQTPAPSAAQEANAPGAAEDGRAPDTTDQGDAPVAAQADGRPEEER